MKFDRSKFFKFLAGLAVSSSIFSSISVFCMENDKALMDKVISIITREGIDPKQELLNEVKKIFKENKENYDLDDNVLFDAVICLGKVVNEVYKSYVVQYGANYAPKHIYSDAFKSNVITSINSSIDKNKIFNGDKFTKHLENAKKLLGYKSAADLMSTLSWRSFN